jgi:hypothetical protein
MKTRGLINCCVLLLWFVATHHCVFEQLILNYRHLPSYQVDIASSECPSHSSSDPYSHNEGKSCGTFLQSNFSNELREATQETLTPIVDVLIVFLSNSLADVDLFHFSSAVSFETSDLIFLSQRANSLSIAPNAPPVTLS